MTDLQTAIENLYMVFGKYTTEGMHYCDCGCINPEDVKKLNSKPLRALEEDDLVRYQGSALYTWGDIEHYKHYLPRILELYSRKREFALMSLDEIFNKLKYANWMEWVDNEVKAIKDYILQDWIEFVNQDEAEISEIQLAVYNELFELKDLISLWDVNNSQLALKKLVYFFYYYGNNILAGKPALNNPDQKSAFISFIHTNKLAERLEGEFFTYELIDTDYAGKVSIVLQMIEQQLKADELSRK